jgi:hypothetical protein
MKKILLMAGALLALTAGLASAQGGINLSWTDCGTFGALQKNFACTSNTTNPGAIIVGSAVTGVQMDQLNGQASVLELQINQPSLDNWWHFETGGCRVGGVTANFDFTASSNCLDPWTGAAAGGVSYTAGYNGPNRARIRTVCAIPGSTGITGTDEYYFFKVTILNNKTVGNGSCVGCLDGACIVFDSINVTQPLGVGDYTISAPINRAYVQWQGGASGVGQGPNGSGCPGATPTHSRTWGSVKSLYR